VTIMEWDQLLTNHITNSNVINNNRRTAAMGDDAITSPPTPTPTDETQPITAEIEAAETEMDGITTTHLPENWHIMIAIASFTITPKNNIMSNDPILLKEIAAEWLEVLTSCDTIDSGVMTEVIRLLTEFGHQDEEIISQRILDLVMHEISAFVPDESLMFTPREAKFKQDFSRQLQTISSEANDNVESNKPSNSAVSIFA
jgi:hypothetical protein